MTKEELQRYARHFVLPEFGREGQEKLRAAKVLVVGAGGLGSPLLLYLAAAGVGEIGIIDDDVVDLSNLQRQVLYTTEDIGKPKAEMAKIRIQALNPHIKVTAYKIRLDIDNVLDIMAPYDIIADGTDNFPTRYLVNDACVLAGKVNVYASIFRFEGQVAVFNYPNPDGSRGVNYRDLFPEPPDPDAVPNCAEGGVLGVLPGIIGSMQANEVIKVATGIGQPLAGRLFMMDTTTFDTRTLKIPKNPNLKIESLEALAEYCATPQYSHLTLSAEEYMDWLSRQEQHFLLDVREVNEYEIHNMGGHLIPLGQLSQKIKEIPTDKKIVVHCKGGVRSTQAIAYLQEVGGFGDLYNLEGGIMAWEAIQTVKK
jgi:adenylyltransferase/sulfurtransferase